MQRQGHRHWRDQDWWKPAWKVGFSAMSCWGTRSAISWTLGAWNLRWRQHQQVWSSCRRHGGGKIYCTLYWEEWQLLPLQSSLGGCEGITACITHRYTISEIRTAFFCCPYFCCYTKWIITMGNHITSKISESFSTLNVTFIFVAFSYPFPNPYICNRFRKVLYLYFEILRNTRNLKILRVCLVHSWPLSSLAI